MRLRPNYIKQLKEELPKLLGDDYSISVDTNNYLVHPDLVDLVVENKKTAQRTVIDLHGAVPESDLPIATIPIMRKWKQSLNQQYNNFIMLTLCNVPDLVREFLTKDNITIVKIDKRKNYLKELKGLLTS
ncbi:hypothetical protein KK083_09940 [Fulvivirgaceae bacterium PWU4]|uniref:Uncharacterized protein n=1 Tax=Chryseosolibacter histidini TaxID=2782349 RepID=A0AAP2DIZ6_9BACT|nr:hypothetical protein [Chryseosolibacter histidini]MBT1697196.1 hypothetical protein [Chryseosolibacter histidini]